MRLRWGREDYPLLPSLTHWTTLPSTYVEWNKAGHCLPKLLASASMNSGSTSLQHQPRCWLLPQPKHDDQEGDMSPASQSPPGPAAPSFITRALGVWGRGVENQQTWLVQMDFHSLHSSILGLRKPQTFWALGTFSINFLNWCVCQGKFNTSVSDSFTLNSSKYCSVRGIRCPRNLKSLFISF